MSATVDSGRGGAARTGAERQQVRASYLLGVFAGLFAMLGAFAALLAWLHHSDNLPPPAFSNSLCVDEKLRFLRHNPIDQPNLLVIGSSVAWRHVDGDVLRSSAPELRPFNGAFCGLHANQSAYVADWLLDRQPSIRQVVMIVDPLDFAGCWKVPDAVFDREDADHYVYQQASRWGYYMRYFSPRSLLRNARTIKAQRANEIEWDPLVFTRHGDGPLEPRADRGLFYGEPDPLDNSCFAALGRLSERLRQEQRQLLVVSTPLHPQWKARFDADSNFLTRFDTKLSAAIAGHGGAKYWNADQEWVAPPGAFVDAIHLRWSAVQDFSEALADQLREAEQARLGESVLAGSGVYGAP
ncbi:hypothetical protein HBN77_05570 [Pseudomonas sp. WS 5018]|uniref:SGNH/GDSL hydrolase family protein n=1 Tax=Stutzerimonas stutzeri TaxID=316 RepID=A0A4S2BG67_STUST|nr:hypothetical protein [Stutzerimonas stutzeri]MBW8454319.1 hypothetical protein [Pseudomonas sp.]NMY63517.1 hypothetical protein [Pseudomonas sp. WS 5018]MDH0145718.1 hypothetical protein [Stutzerimonas stutzeri]MDH0149437.1 hypothetical protein [Stutzerimonas stutzeri]MDH0154879.1 hypothetical protein [Stutzerimonas stutzeri]